MNDEKRKHRRVKAKNVAGHVRVRDEVLALGLPIDNISMGGLFVRCEAPLPVGTQLSLELLQPKLGLPLKVVGTTVLSLDAARARAAGATAGMGVRFDPLPLEATTKLRALLATLSEEARPEQVGGHNPAEIDEQVERSRDAAFDFSFVSLDEFSPGSEDDAPPAFFAPPAPKQAPAPKPTAGAADVPTHAVLLSNAAIEPPAPEPGAATAKKAVGDAPIQVSESAKLMVQVRGLLLDLDETRAELERRAHEMERLQQENARLTAALRKRELRVAELELRLEQR